jgi:hypothetical protein
LDAMSNTYQCVLVEATLSPGEYADRLVARAPDPEVTRRAPTPSVLPLPFPLACR